jgi:hypothetical protein
MTGEKENPRHGESPAVDEAELAEDLEIKDAEDAESVRGGASDQFLKLDGIKGESSDRG